MDSSKLSCVSRWEMEGSKFFRRFENFLKRSRICLFAGLLLILTGCVTLKDPEASQEYRTDVVVTLLSGSEAGQTFLARRQGVNAIQLWLRPTPNREFPPGSFINIRLYHSPTDDQPVYSTRLNLSRLEAEFPVTVTFHPLPDPPNQTYYLSLKSEGLDVDIFGRNEDAYANGSLYRDGERAEADLSFRLSYDYNLEGIFGDLITSLKNIWLFVPLIAVLWLPGRVLLQVILRSSKTSENQVFEGLPGFDWGERVALSIGLSLALISTVILWTSALGLEWTPLSAWVACAGLVLISCWQARALLIGWWGIFKRLLSFRSVISLSSVRMGIGRLSWTSLALAGIFMLSLAVRLAMVRDLAVPAWVDSVHHAVIIRRIVEAGALPATYLPYLQSQYANYHSGFHAANAFFLWLSQMAIPSGMLLFSQTLNALSVFSVYLFTITLTSNRPAGIIAALIAGLFTPMPAYFASWGRFTQLAGTLILPVCLALILRQINRLEIERPKTPSLFFRGPGLFHTMLSGLALAGLALTHYRVLLFFICLFAAHLAVNWVSAIRNKRLGITAAMHLSVLSSAAGLAVLFSLPWWPGVIQTMLIPKVGTSLSSLGNWVKPFGDFSWGYLNTALGDEAMLLAGLGWLLAIARRKPFALVLVLWVVILFILANPGAFGLPGLAFVNNTSVEIILFMPIAVLAGYLSIEIANIIALRLSKKWAQVFRAAMAVVGLAAALWGARTLMPILNQGTILTRQADLAALQWIEKNIPQEEVFLINSFFWGYGKLAGNDGGYWIAPLAGNQTLPPPVLHGLSNPPAVQRQVDNLAKQAYEKSSDPAGLYALMKANHIRYIYIGVRGGPLSARALKDSGMFNPLYNQAGTWVFILN